GEKEIIAATFKQMADKTATPQQAADAATRLAEMQAALHHEISMRLLEMRTQEPWADREIENNLQAVADATGLPVESLRQQKWSEAIKSEQSALQALLHADASDLRTAVRKLASPVESQAREQEIDFMRRQLEQLARSLDRLSSQMEKTTPAELDEATQQTQLAEQLLKRLQDGLREVALAQADTR